MAETPEANVFSRTCPSRSVLLHLTGRWGCLVVTALAEGSLRFGDIRRRIEGISDRMLSQTLSQLERDGIVSRTVRCQLPPHVEYSLTALGKKIEPALDSLISLVEDNLPAVEKARKAYDDTHSRV